MELADIKRLAGMARIEMSEEEMQGMLADFAPILAYVDQIKEATSDSVVPVYQKINVMRDDVVTNERGECTEKILDQMPATEKGYLKVKKIL